MKVLKEIAVTALAVMQCACSLAAAQAQDAPHGDAANGKRLYLADGCFTCHGRSGQGGAYNTPAPILAHTAMPFDGFKGQVRNPINDMPAFPRQFYPTRTSPNLCLRGIAGGSALAEGFPILNN